MYRAQGDLKLLIGTVVDDCVSQELRRNTIKQFLLAMVEHQTGDLAELIKSVSTSSTTIEQDIKENAVNILTMHQAKGLTFDVCFIVGAEDEFLSLGGIPVTGRVTNAGSCMFQ